MNKLNYTQGYQSGPAGRRARMDRRKSSPQKHNVNETRLPYDLTGNEAQEACRALKGEHTKANSVPP